MDVLKETIENCCVVDANVRVIAGELYEAYESWCIKNGERELTQTILAFSSSRGISSSTAWPLFPDHPESVAKLPLTAPFPPGRLVASRGRWDRRAGDH